jgi:hypothetical protein
MMTLTVADGANKVGYSHDEPAGRPDVAKKGAAE